MSRSIDERIVEMRFDNKQFESGIKESMQSLNKLEDVLNHNISAESLENISRAANSIDVSGLNKAIETINDRFSTLGIVGMTVIANLANGLINTLGRAVSTVSDAIVSGGVKRAMNIENAHFQLQGIINDEKEVDAVMKQANESVDGTAYSYDVAAKAASMFAATGIKSGEGMENALKGIAGVAATTNSDYESMAQIFTKVAGNGRLMGDELLQLSSHGMNAAAALANYFNKVNDGSVTATENVKNAIQQLTGATEVGQASSEARIASIEKEYEAASEAFEQEYKIRQDTFNKEYKALQKNLDNEYNLKKAAYDEEYKALQKTLDKEYKALQETLRSEYNAQKERFDNEYKELQKSLDTEYKIKKEAYDKEYKELQQSLDAEIKAQQKANDARVKEAEAAYKEDVSNYKKATEEKIALIDEEYAESIKLIDKEAYDRMKAIDDQIQGIEDAAEAEEKAKKEAERATKLTELNKAVANATSVEERIKAEAALAAYQKKLAEEDLAESRKAQIAKLKEEKAAIKEEADLKKQEAKDKRNAAVESVKEESEATLAAMADKHSSELESLKESLNAQLEEMRNSRDERLETLRSNQTAELEAVRENQQGQLSQLKASQEAQLASLQASQNAQLEAVKESQSKQLENLRSNQNAELAAMKESHSAQLEAVKESQNAQLEALKKANSAKLKEMKKAADEQTKALSGFSTSAKVTEADIREMVSKGLISFDIFSEAMATTFGDHAKDANKTFLGSLANIKAALSRTGALFISPLIEQDGEFVKFFNVIREKINDFNKVLGATNGVADKFVDFVKTAVSILTNFIEKIDVSNSGIAGLGDLIASVFGKATDVINEWGTKLSSILSEHVKSPFEAIKDIGQTVINMFNGLVSILKPVGEAFGEVFSQVAKKGAFTDLASTIADLTSHFKLSKEAGSALKTLFTGLFKIIKSITSIFGKLITKTTSHITKTDKLSSSISKLVSFVGDLLIKMADWLDKSPWVQKAIDGIATGLGVMGDALSTIIHFVSSGEALDKIVSVFKDITGIDLNEVANSIENFVASILHLKKADDESTEIGSNIISGIIQGIEGVAGDLWETLTSIGNTILQTVKDVLGIQSPSKEGESIGGYFIEGIVNGIKAGFDKIKDKASDLASKLLDGTSDGLSLFKDDLGGIVSLIGGGSLIYLLVKLGKGFEQVASALSGLFGRTGGLIGSATSALGSVKDVADAYTKDLKADAFMKTAIGLSIGIAVITGALIALSKQDPDKLLAAAGSLAVVAYVFGNALERLLWTLSQTKTVESALTTAAKGLKNGFSKLGQAVKIKAVGSAIKDFAISVGIIVASIAGIYLMYRKDKESFNAAVTTVGSIFAVLVIIAGVMATAGEKLSKGMSAFAKLGVGVLALSLAVLVAVAALKKILKLDFNFKRDGDKLVLLGILFAGVAGLAIAIGAASRIAGDGGLKTGPLLAMCLLILSSVSALKKVLNLKLPDDWKTKMAIFAGLFAALGVLMIAIGAASKLAGGQLKATGTILAMCLFVGTVVVALTVLAIFPAEMLKKGALALGGILLVLGLVLVMASKIGGEAAGKVVLGMAALIGAIVISLALLSFIEPDKLMPGALALGGVLFVVALVFAGVSKITNEDAWKTVLSMVAVIGAVIGGLYVLSSVESWENLVAAGIAMAAVLLAVGKAFSTLNSSETPEMDHIMEWILGILSVAAIAQILRSMGDLDWKTLLASGASIAGVLMGISESFKIMNSSEKVEPENMLNFIVGIIGAGIIGMILAIFSKGTDWDSLLGLGASISMVLVAIGACFAIMNTTNVDLKSIGSFAAGVVGVWAIAAIISEYANQPWEQMLGAGVSIAIVLLAMSIVMVIAGAVGTLGPAAAIGLATLDGFILSLWGILEALGRIGDLEVIKNGGEKLSAIGKALGDFVGSIIEGIGEGVGRALEAIGKSLSKFMQNAQPFFDGLANMNQDTVKAAGALAGVVLALAAAEVLDSISSLFSLFTGEKDMGSFGKKLVDFGIAIQAFDLSTRLVDAGHLKTVAEGAKALIDIARAIPNEGGWLAKLVGENDIGEFGASLARFAPGLVAFDLGTRMIKDVSNWKNIAEGTKYLVDLAAAIPNEGGWLAKLVGENDIGEFGKSLTEFGRNIAPFHNAVKNIQDTSNWKSIAEGTKYLVDLAQNIPNEGGWLQNFVGNTNLGSFGKSITEFGRNIAPFHNAVKNIQDTSNWSLIADGAKMLMNSLADMQGGLLTNKVTEANISTIGKTISIFGKHIATFNTSVSGIQNTSNWILIANGAKTLMTALTDMQGGLLRNKVTEANINSICKSIVTFGSNIAKFNAYISGIQNTAQWLSVANGTKILMNTLVDMQGGLLRNKVTEANISTIGKTISTFGRYISTFNTYVSGIRNTTQWFSVANGAKTLTDTIISMQGGLLRNKVTEANITSICKSILNLGVYMSKFNTYVTDIKLPTILNIVKGVNALVSMCRNIETIDPSVMSKFSSDMAKMAKNGLQSFISTFTKQTTVALTTVSTMINKVKDSAKNDTTVQKAFYDLALRSLSNTTGYIRGINDKTSSVITAITTLLNKIIKTIKSKDNEYKTLGTNQARLYTDAVNSFASKAKAVGENIGKSTVSGIASVANSLKDASEKLARAFTTNFEREGKDKVRDAAMELTNAAVRVFNDRNDTFEDCGENAGEGFARGMRRKVDDVANTARDMAWEARRSIEDELGIYSPSRVLRADGQYTGEGFALGLLDRIRRVKEAAIELAQASVDGVNGTAGSITDVIEDLDPVITPMVDLTNVMEAANTINDLFANAIANVGSKVANTSNSMNRKQLTNDQQNIQNGEDMSGTNVTFIQNNNSPKALSRIDIYRQTRNQLSQFREAIERT